MSKDGRLVIAIAVGCSANAPRPVAAPLAAPYLVSDAALDQILGGPPAMRGPLFEKLEVERF